MTYLYFMFVSRQVLLALLIVFSAERASCQLAIASKIEGRTMGTTYSVIYFDEHRRDFSFAIDSLLMCVNKGISNYDPVSDVTDFNKSRDGGKGYSIHFRNLLARSVAYAKASAGYFDPTVMPLVNLWGFGPGKKGIPSQQKIDSIKNFTGYRHIAIERGKISKDHPEVQVDFGGIGQGYGVDVVCDFLNARGVQNFLVELGGEGFASGKNLERNANWRVGIVDPFSPKDDQQLIGYAIVEDEAFTTAGNYFNYRIIDGKKYGHTISPFTGFPVEHDLISVSLFSSDCTGADAWDTAFLVAGKDQAIDFLKRNPDLAAVLIFMENEKPQIFISEKIKNKIFLENSYDH